MAKLPVPIAFDWEQGNIEKNRKKHGVHDKEAEEVFFNKPLRIFPDKKHSQKEERFLALGMTNLKRKVTIIFTIRYDEVRIISVRDQNRKERTIYEKTN